MRKVPTRPSTTTPDGPAAQGATGSLRMSYTTPRRRAESLLMEIARPSRAKPFGPRGVPLPPIGQGTWQMERDDRRAAVDAISRGIDAGLTHIDTAEMYGGGEVEEIVAEAISGRREQVFLASKVLPSNASREGTQRACEKSLKRLRTDHLDLYLLHWPGAVPLEDTIGAFERLVEQGKLRSWGVSNFGVEDLERAI